MSKEKLLNLYLLPNPWWKDYFSKELLLIDTKDRDILNRLDNKNVKYKLYECFERLDPQDKYSIVHLRIRYRHVQGLLDELEKFCKNAPLLGYTDYADYCKMICDKLTGKDKEKND